MVNRSAGDEEKIDEFTDQRKSRDNGILPGQKWRTLREGVTMTMSRTMENITRPRQDNKNDQLRTMAMATD